MSIKKIFTFLFGGIGLFAALLIIFTIMMFNSMNDLEEKEEVRFQSYLKADELRQSSDDLTRLARTYSLTGDPKYEKMYWDILDIRNGKKPRPQDYERIYWDFVAGDGQKPRPDDKTISLNDLMKELGFSEAEFAKLKEAQSKSDALVMQETIAMNAVKGLFDDGSGNFTVQGEPDLELAAKLTHNQKYHEEKAKIMKPLDEFFVLLKARTKAEVEEFKSQANTLMISLITLSIITAVLCAFGFVIIRKKVNLPVEILQKETQKVAKGDFDRQINLDSKDELGELSKHFNVMVSNIKKANNDLASEKENIQQKVDEAIKASEEEKKYLQESVNEILTEMNKFANGDLTVELKAKKDDAIGQLFNGFNNSVKNIKQMMLQISEAIQATASATSEISSSTEQMVAGSQEQSSQAAEVASAIEEMAATIMQSTQNANSAAENANNAVKIANDGGSVVRSTVVGMNKISEVVSQAASMVRELGKNSDEIGAIIQVIDDIADQTNLLALNAAIEAARAGEQGRGFAVVADEVRKLAERTTKATKEIADMIKKIQGDTSNAVHSIESGTEEVEKGKELAGKSGESLELIIKGSNETVEVVKQVADASDQQSQAIEQISRSVEGINNVSNESAAGIQEIARVTEDLNRLTENLHNLVGNFKLDDNKGYSTKTKSVHSNEYVS